MDKNTIDSIPNPIIIYDSAWKIHTANLAALDAFGYTNLEQLKGKEILTIVHTSDHLKLKKLQQQIEEGLSNKQRVNLSHLLNDPTNPSERYLSQFTRLNNHVPDNSFAYMESAISLKEGSNCPEWVYPDADNFKILSENIPGLEMFLVDQNLHIHGKLGRESFNQNLHNKQNEGTDFYEYFIPEVQSVILPLLSIAFESTPVSREFFVDNNFFSLRLIPLNPKKKKPLCVIVLQNITETKLIENKLKYSKQEAEKANRAKDSFVAKMSHEIRTPLNAVIGFTDQLTKTRLSKKQSEFVEVVNNSSQHLLAIIDDILVLSKIESGMIELDEAPFMMEKIYASIEQLLELKYKRKGLQFHILTNIPANTRLLGDPAKLSQVLLNLANNAIKFTSKGKVILKFALKHQSREHVKVCFEVSDTGIGITQEEIKHIFKPFKQVNNSLDRNFSGCGLGLTISKDLIKTMGGNLSVNSTPGKGSTFSFALTFKIAPHAEYFDETFTSTPNIEKKYNDSPHNTDTARKLNKLSSNKEQDDSYRIKSYGHLRILFVDDDPVNILLGKIILKKQKIKTDFVSSGQQALKLFQPGRYDIIFLDINMADINGLEVTRQIRLAENNLQNIPRTPIVAMTANAVRKHLKQYLNAGMDSVLLKPYNEESFYKKITKLTNKNPIKPKSSIQKSYQETTGNSYDLTTLLEITQGDYDFTLMMLSVFVKNSEELLGKIRSALERDDYAGIGEAAHKLIPSVEQLAIEKATNLLKKVEDRYLNNNHREKDPELINATINELHIGIEAIKHEINERSKTTLK